MSYTIKQEGTDFVVRDSDDQRQGSYPTEEQAKRRVRDLKRRDKRVTTGATDTTIKTLEGVDPEAVYDRYNHPPRKASDHGVLAGHGTIGTPGADALAGFYPWAPGMGPKPDGGVLLVGDKPVADIESFKIYPYQRAAMAQVLGSPDHAARALQNLKASVTGATLAALAVGRFARATFSYGGGVYPARTAPRYPMGRARTC